MTAFMKFLPILMKLFFTIPDLVKTAEVAFSGVPGKSGQAKKDLVMGSVNVAAGVAAELGALSLKQQELVNQMTSTAVELVVTGIKEVEKVKEDWSVKAGGPDA